MLKGTLADASNSIDTLNSTITSVLPDFHVGVSSLNVVYIQKHRRLNVRGRKYESGLENFLRSMGNRFFALYISVKLGRNKSKRFLRTLFVS